MRLMTWNIRTGGGDRLDAIAQVIVAEAPDVLALQELRGFAADGGRRLRELAGAVGMTPWLAPSWRGQPVAALVRPPGYAVTHAAARPWRLHHAAATMVVPTEHGDLTVVSTHLQPFSAHRRMREARWLAGRFPASRGLVVLMGDLNGLDPWTDHTEALRRLPEPYRRRHLDNRGTVDTRTVATFASAGFVDLWRVAGSGVGLTAPTRYGGGREFSGMRLDYVLGSPSVAALTRGCRVVTGGHSDHASDHYPVVAELDLRLQPSPDLQVQPPRDLRVQPPRAVQAGSDTATSSTE